MDNDGNGNGAAPHANGVADAAVDRFEWVENAPQAGRWPPLQISQFWTHRELIYFFALRDVKVRYKQAFLGVAWAGIQPVIGALTFTILFNRLADVDVGGRSYFAFALLGFGVWTYFSTSVQVGTGSLLHNSELLTKVSFPRVVAPAATFVPGLIDLTVALVLATAVSIVTSGDAPGVDLVLLPVGVAMLIVSVAGPVFFLSAAIVKYRDASTLVTFALQFLLFASPVAYPPEFVPSAWRWVLYANPVAGTLGLLRAALVGAERPPIGYLALSAGAAVVMFVLGLSHFRRREREFADII